MLPLPERGPVVEVVLHPRRDRSVRRRHPWILSGAVARVEGDAEPGAWARVHSAEGEVLGYGHLSPQSKLRVRVLAFGKDEPGPDLISARIGHAVERRGVDPLLAETDAVRLVNAEGDGLPGLVVDRYRDTVVVKLASAGMAARRDEVTAALREATGAAAGFERGDAASARREGVAVRQGALWGETLADPIWIGERGRRYAVDVVAGQKTGFYLDQRDARDLVQSLTAGRRVLDAFAYSGGFAVAAARGGASRVTLVESSAGALELARRNLAENAPEIPAVFEREDVFRFLRADTGEYDLLVVDPPPLARQRRDVERATRAYKDALLHALHRAAPGARLLAFACSHHVGPELFRKVVFGASLDAGRPLRVLRPLGPPADHPVSIDHPEGAYLNGLLLET
jgi:23S rRNA (cytosine1962-C5)-methyltransferase